MTSIALAAFATLGSGLGTGCCAVASWACGPDRSQWISVDRSTPALALDTFREAVRREAQRELFYCLSEEFKERTGLSGLFEWQVAWDRLREQFPSLFVLGDADLVGESLERDGRVRFDLEIAGEAASLWFVPEYFYSVKTLKQDGTPREAGRFVSRDQLASLFGVPSGDSPRIRIELPPTPAFSIDPDAAFENGVVQARLAPEDLVALGLGQHWKLDDFQAGRPER